METASEGEDLACNDGFKDEQRTPRRSGQREVHDEPRMPAQPRLDLSMAVGGVVVGDEVQREVLGRLSIEEPQEAEPFAVVVARLAHRDDAPVERVERREQCRRDVALVVVRHRAGAAGFHQQAWLRSADRLDLALLVAAQDECMLGPVEVEANDVEQFVLEVRIARALGSPAQMRLQAVVAPDIEDHCGPQSLVGSERSRAPVRGVGRRLVQRQPDDPRARFGIDHGRATRAGCILAQRFDATGDEAMPPYRDLPAVEIDPGANLRVSLTLGGYQHDIRLLLQPRLDATTSRQRSKLQHGRLVQLDALDGSHRSNLLSDSIMSWLRRAVSRALH